MMVAASFERRSSETTEAHSASFVGFTHTTNYCFIVITIVIIAVDDSGLHLGVSS